MVALLVRHICLLSQHDLRGNARICGLVVLPHEHLPDWLSVPAARLIRQDRALFPRVVHAFAFEPFYGCCKLAITNFQVRHAQLLTSVVSMSHQHYAELTSLCHEPACFVSAGAACRESNMQTASAICLSSLSLHCFLYKTCLKPEGYACWTRQGIGV